MRQSVPFSAAALLALSFTLALAAPSLRADDADASTTRLPPPRKEGGKPLMSALAERKSVRAFDTSRPLPLQTLSDLLWAANGVSRADGKRTAPSAHNWQEISIYVASASGLHLYDPVANTLSLSMSKDVRSLCGVQDFVKTAPAVLIFVADMAKMKNVSDAEKLFYAATDTGYVSQNVYLYCASEGLATVVIGWLDKGELAKAMGLGAESRVVLTQPVGFPAPQ